MLRYVTFLALTLSCAAALAGALVTDIGAIRWAPVDAAPLQAHVELNGVVTYVRPDGFVLSANADREQKVVFVRCSASVRGPHAIAPGDTLTVSGVVVAFENTAVVQAASLMRTGHVTLGEPPSPKWYDVRKGWRHLRRARHDGIVADVAKVTRPDGSVETVYTLHHWVYNFSAHVLGDVTGEAARPGSEVEIRGVTLNVFDAKGAPVACYLEAASPADVRVVVPETGWLWRLAIGAVLTVVAALLVGFAIAWLIGRGRIRRQQLIAAERRRMAGELHDTVEQYFAAAKTLVTGALHVPDVPPRAAALLAQAAATMARAKLEVRDAVMDLRGDLAEARPLADLLRDLGRQVAASGVVRVRMRLAAWNGRKVTGAVGRDVVAIVREAMTNAVKHGHAKNIALVAEAESLRVVNDGEPFDAATALGPETGHYGLAVMRERALRSGLGLDFFNKGRWTGLRLDMKGVTS